HDRGYARAVGGIEENLVGLVRARAVLRELPRLAFGDVPVERADEGPGTIDRAGDVEGVDRGRDTPAERVDLAGELLGPPRGRGQPAVPELRHHGGGAREQVSEIVAELAFVPLADPADGPAAVLAERDRPRAPEAHGVGAVALDQPQRVDGVAERLRDLE